MKRDLEELAWIFRSLGYRRRLEIIDALIVNGPMSVTSLVEKLNMNQTAVSQNLAILGRAGFVTSKRSGKYMIYKIKTVNFSPRKMFLLWMIIDSVCEKEQGYGLDNLVSTLLSGNYKKFLSSFGPGL